MNGNNDALNLLIQQFSDEFDYSLKETAIVLAAGHGKRIKSHTSKMLHEIWGKPTSQRVAEACETGLKEANVILVVGIKAAEVIQKLGKKVNRSYVLQAVQNGTGHAVQVAIENIDETKYDGTVFVFPGDMGLIDAETVEEFKKEFYSSGGDMTVLTGVYKGDPANNNYGRIVRVKEKDRNGNPSGEDYGKVIEIKEHKDILKLGEDELYTVSFRGKEYSFTKQELIENNEFNSGVFAFKFRLLKELINNIDTDNAQGEIYLTDMISIFNNSGYSVSAVSPEK
ncbi:MAG: NTP transferase domain-containing protein, partial [Chlorobi bacterium]|nr:NTP transferase domain-containing protein [Chlorobiota bacterium]